MKLFAEEAQFYGIPEEKLLKLKIMEGYIGEEETKPEVRSLLGFFMGRFAIREWIRLASYGPVNF